MPHLVSISRTLSFSHLIIRASWYLFTRLPDHPVCLSNRYHLIGGWLPRLLVRMSGARAGAQPGVFPPYQNLLASRKLQMASGVRAAAVAIRAARLSDSGTCST
jgi:hypothetical protein